MTQNSEPLFSIVAICKNEANTLPRLLGSLQEFKDRGGKFFLLDTGSKDDSVKIAKKWGAVVYEVGEKFIKYIDKKTADAINRKFIVAKEPVAMKEGDRLFDFAAARNYISDLAEKDFIVTLDCDEAYSKFDIDAINKLIEEGVEQLEYQFVYAHDGAGRPHIQFVQSKAYDKRKIRWGGIVHEVLGVKPGVEFPNIKYVGPEIILLEHYQEQGKEHRGNYLIGLLLDCYMNPERDRQSHYAARELFYTGRYESAIKEFKRHVKMNGWGAERAQSMTYIGDCYGKLNQPELQIEYYNKAFYNDSQRREPLIKAAEFMLFNKNYKAAAAYAAAALELPWVDYYANDKRHYESVPHFILYVSKGWLGDIEGAKHHLLKALQYSPGNPEYLRDTQYYFEYPDNGIEGWMRFPELQFLYEEAKKHKTIVEVGSFKGKSTHALLSGCKKGTVTAVDTWEGSANDRADLTNYISKSEDVFSHFQKNTSKFNNLKFIRKASLEAAKDFEDASLDMVFIDATHLHEDVKKDIEAWLPKVKPDGVLCGHDFDRVFWPGVVQAVEEAFGEVEMHDSIWVYRKGHNRIPKRIFTIWLNDKKEVPELVHRCIQSQKIYGYEHKLITLENCFRNEYINRVLSSSNEKTKYVLAADYLRLHYLYEEGGIYLDSDVEIWPDKNFDDFLKEEMFLGLEQEFDNPSGIVIGNAVIGSRKKHPFLKHLMDRMGLVRAALFESPYKSGMDMLNVEGVKFQDKFKLVPKKYFYAPNNGGIFPPEAICLHHFMNSWVDGKISGSEIEEEKADREETEAVRNTFSGGLYFTVLEEFKKQGKEKLPAVSIIIPQLGRDEGLARCLESIHALDYPHELIDIQIIEGEETVPEKVKKGVAKSESELICYAANDIVFTKESLLRAVRHSGQFSLIAFNTGDLLPDKGNTCEHFLIKRSFLPQLENGEVFCTDMNHVGVDNFLWAQAERLGQAYWCEDAVVIHNHFSKPGGKMDSVYEKGWAKMEEDRKTLKERLEKLKSIL